MKEGERERKINREKEAEIIEKEGGRERNKEKEAERGRKRKKGAER